MAAGTHPEGLGIHGLWGNLCGLQRGRLYSISSCLGTVWVPLSLSDCGSLLETIVLPPEPLGA